MNTNKFKAGDVIVSIRDVNHKGLIVGVTSFGSYIMKWNSLTGEYQNSQQYIDAHHKLDEESLLIKEFDSDLDALLKE